MAREQRRRPRTRAEQLRRHREEMEFAVAHGLSLEEAREGLASYRAHLSRLATPAGELPPARPPVEAERPLQWWQRD